MPFGRDFADGEVIAVYGAVNTGELQGLVRGGAGRSEEGTEPGGGQAAGASTGDQARRSLAFSRPGDPNGGDFADAEVIAVFGTVDTDALQG